MDTSFILRQASPYMKIKFYLQENNNIPCQKRKAALFITERTKRRKANISEVPVINGNDVVMDATASSKISVKDSAGEDICKQGYAEFHAELQKIKRSEEVMRNFARALLSTLKQYKDKLKESENEVQYLKETLRKQSAHAKEMEKELNETRNIRLCVSNPPVEECAKALSFNPGVSVPPIPSDPDHIQDTVALGDENNSFLGDMSAEAFSSLPSEENVELSYQLQEQSGLKIALNENVQQSTASHSTEALKSEEDDPSLRPLNSQRPKRMLLPASAIHFKDFNGLFMDENAMEVKRKKTDNVKARSDGSISLIRILKSNLPR